MHANQTQGVLEKLQQLSEYKLQTTLIVPLLRNSGYSVRDVSGPHEAGKDLVATFDDVGYERVLVVQIKMFKFSGSASNPSESLQGLLHQLGQAAIEEVVHPSSGTLTKPHEVLFITPFDINELTLRSNIADWREQLNKKLRILAGTHLVKELIKRCPRELQLLDDGIGYQRIADEQDSLRESAAFPVVQRLSLSETYVEAEFGLFDLVCDLIRQLLFWDGDRQSLTHERAQIRDIDPNDQGRAEKLEKRERERKKIKLKGLAAALHVNLKSDAWDNVPAEITFLTLAQFCYEMRDTLRTQKKNHAFPESAARLLCLIPELQHQAMVLFKSNEMLSQFASISPDTLSRLRRLQEDLESGGFVFSCENVIDMGRHLLILGKPGYGKTTLLKMTWKRAFDHAWDTGIGKPPVLIRALDIQEPDVSGIVEAARQRLQEFDIAIDSAKLQSELDGGERALLIDGLDEVASRVQFNKLKKTVSEMVRNPKVRLIISSRDSIDFSDWQDAARLTLRPFTDAQLSSYFSRFFSDDNTSALGINEFLFSRDNAGLRDVVRTPMLAALLCTLFKVDADLPATEVELYEQRFALLLGRWQQAKGIRPMAVDVRRQYEMFLMNVAFITHTEQTREISPKALRSQAVRFVAQGYNAGVDSFISDCVERGVIVSEGTGRFSFGHLTYQEYLCAKYFIYYGEKRDLARKLGEKWWRKTLMFYAAMTQDIGHLIKTMEGGLESKQEAELESLVRIARFTQWSNYRAKGNPEARQQSTSTEDWVKIRVNRPS